MIFVYFYCNFTLSCILCNSVFQYEDGPLPNYIILSKSAACVCVSASVPGACRATGRGLQPRGVRVSQVADFKVDTHNAGSGDLKVTVKGPSE